MNEKRIFADAYQTTFADPKEMLEFLAQRAKESSWIRKPTRTLRLVPAIQEVGKMKDTVGKNWEEILEDTENNTQLALKIKGETYPVRTCAIRTILDRAGISGSGLRKLETANYAKVVNYCLKVAKGDALIKIADGKVSAVHGGDHHDYSILDMRAVFEMTMQFLNTNFPGNSYVEGSGMFDHSIVSAMWELGGNQELLDTYRDALSDHGISDNIIAPAVRLTTSDVAVSGANLYPMLTCSSSGRTISLGSPIKLAHTGGADMTQFLANLRMLCSRYQDAISDITKLMDIEIHHPLNCIRLLMKRLGIRKKLINDVAEMFEFQKGNGPCTAHDIYFEGLKAQNPDVAAWIQIPALSVSYPVVQGKDNSYYLHHMFDGQENKNGSIFIDYHNQPDFTDSNTIIYGHNMKNGSMFGTLDRYQEKSLFEQYPCFYIYLPDGILEYRVVSCYAGRTGSVGYTYRFPEQEDFQDFLEKILSYASYNTGTEVTDTDHIVTLSTCVNSNRNYRYLVHGKLERKIEMR